MAGIAALGAGSLAAIIGVGARLGSTIIGGIAQARAGRAERDAAYFEADQMESLAGEERAAGQRDAFEIDRQVNTLLSRGRAVAAASGAGASDSTVANVQADLATAGRARSDMANYTANARASALETQAEMRRRGGRASLTAGRLAAFGTIIGGTGSAASDFGTWASTYGGTTAPDTGTAGGGFMPTGPAPSGGGLLRRIFGGA